MGWSWGLDLSCQHVVLLPNESFLPLLFWQRDGSSNGTTAAVFLICDLCNLLVKEGACLDNVPEDFGVHCTTSYISCVLSLMINFFFEVEYRDTGMFCTYLNICNSVVVMPTEGITHIFCAEVRVLILLLWGWDALCVCEQGLENLWSLHPKVGTKWWWATAFGV